MEKKRTVIVLVTTMIIIICCCCTEFSEYEHLEYVSQNGQPLYNLYPIKTYLDNDNYSVVIFEDAKIVKGVEFSADRQAVDAIGIELVTISDMQNYLGKNLTDVENEFGSYHTDIGSGHFMPSYITADGYLICFTIERKHDTICHVGKTDLFTGESVEWYCVNENAEILG